jgi:Uma2 family endonuclease
MRTSTPPLHGVEIEYPESDGRPLGETDIHRQEILDAIAALTEYYRLESQTYVAGNLMFYYEEGNPRASLSPDVFVVRGIPKGLRRTYKLWEEGRAPDMVIEVTSRSTRREDMQHKRNLYARIGVQEYFLYDPLAEYLKPPLQGFRLESGQYAPIAPAADGSLRCAALGLRLSIENQRLRLTDEATGEPLLRPAEVAAALRSEAAARQAEAAARQAEAAARSAAEQQLAEREAELARLQAELERLRTGNQPGEDV